MKKDLNNLLLRLLVLSLTFFFQYTRADAVSPMPENFRQWGTYNPDTDAEAERKLFSDRFSYVGHETNRKKDSLSSYQKEGHILFVPHYLKHIYPDTLPLKDEVETQISVSVSPGEYEPFSFAVHALNDTIIEAVDVEEMKGNGHGFARGNFDVRVVRHLYKAVPTKTGKQAKFGLSYSLFPVLLEKRTQMRVEKNHTVQFWGTVFVPPDTAPGVYRGKITLRFGSGKKASIPLNMTVYPFTLMTPDITYGLFYSLAKKDPNYPANIKKEFLDMKYHGINALGLMSVPAFTKKDGRTVFDFSEDMGGEAVGLQQLVDAYLEAGFTGPVNYTFMTNRLVRNPRKKWADLELYSEEFNSSFVQLVKQIQDKKKEGWPQFYFGIDEPSGKKKEPGKYYLKLLKDLPGVVTVAELNGLTYGFNDARYFEPSIDIECFNRKIRDVAFAIKRSGQRGTSLCVYNPASSGRYPVPERYSFGFDAWRTGAKMIWQWNYHQGSDFSWKEESGEWASGEADVPGTKRTYMAFAYGYPAPDGPVPSVSWEALREGIDDARYIFTLEQYIEKAERSGDSSAAKEAGIAQSIVHKIKKELPVESADREGYLSGLAPERLDELRSTIADRIIMLKKVLEGPGKKEEGLK